MESWSFRLVASRVLCEAVHDMWEDAVAAHSEPVRLAASAADYTRFSLAKDQVEPWEDGLRLDTAAPAHLVAAKKYGYTPLECIHDEQTRPA